MGQFTLVEIVYPLFHLNNKFYFLEAIRFYLSLFQFNLQLAKFGHTYNFSSKIAFVRRKLTPLSNSIQ